jgi:hypothetical protein
MRRGTSANRVLLLAALLLPPAAARAQEFAPGPSVYGRVEALQWRIQDAPMSFPLLTSTNAPAIGTVGDPNTSILLGGGPIYMGMRNGGRVTAGAWVDPFETFGGEVSAFGLDRFSASGTFTDNSGSLRIGMPYFDAAAGVPAVHAISAPSFLTPTRTIFIPDSERRVTIPGVFIPGDAAIVGFNTRSQLLGYDVNGMYGAGYGGPIRLDLLGGFRYLRLTEDMLLLANSTGQPTTGDAFTTSDSFTTRNSFYGGQVGARLSFDGGFVFAEVTGKVAAGPMFEQVDVAGSFLTTSFDPMHNQNVYPGGVYAQRTNIGSSTSTQFAIAGEMQANAGVQVGPLRAFIGFSFLYVTSVARPGNQISPFINPNQSEAILQSASPTGLGSGPFVPARDVHSSTFWAQGVSIGLELRY